MKKTTIENWVSTELEVSNFEDILEVFGLTPVEVFNILYEAGHVDEDLLESYVNVSDRF